MAALEVPITAITKTGVAPPAEVAGDPTNGNVVKGIDRDVILTVKNAHATLARTVTFVTPGNVEGQAVADRVESIPAVTTKRYAGLSPSLYSSDLTLTPESSDIKLTAERPS